jgi:hypothetical protein
VEIVQPALGTVAQGRVGPFNRNPHRHSPVLHLMLHRFTQSAGEALEMLGNLVQHAQHENGYLKSRLSEISKCFQYLLSGWGTRIRT